MALQGTRHQNLLKIKKIVVRKKKNKKNPVVVKIETTTENIENQNKARHKIISYRTRGGRVVIRRKYSLVTTLSKELQVMLICHN